MVHTAHTAFADKGAELTAAGQTALAHRLQGMLGGLSLQFLLGLALATVASYDASSHTGNRGAFEGILLLHMLVALGLVAGSVALAVKARHLVPRLSGMAWAGLVAILISAAAGMARLSADSEWLTFLMGAGFIAAVGIYGRMLGEVLKQHGPEA